MTLLEGTIARIRDIDEKAATEARKRQDELTKPRGSLGRLEELSIRIAGIKGTARPTLGTGIVFVMAADHGVCAEGVSAYPQEVTMQMVENILSGGAGISVLARQVGARVAVTDVGLIGDIEKVSQGQASSFYAKKIARGTKNMAREAAMSRDEARLSIEAGIEVFEAELSRASFGIAATGDMGIGNTSPSTAIASAMTGMPARALVGRGTGVDDEGLAKKLAAIERALELHKPDRADAIGVLAAVGGFEIGAIAGVILAAAANRIPVLIDGFISGAGALIARCLAPISARYLFAAHVSADSGHKAMLDSLGLKPLLDLGMRLGEGTGAALAIPICDAACRVLDEMATFGEAGVSDKE